MRGYAEKHDLRGADDQCLFVDHIVIIILEDLRFKCVCIARCRCIPPEIPCCSLPMFDYVLSDPDAWRHVGTKTIVEGDKEVRSV